ncbi:hypothetical protein SCALM49S_05323 [Streptomyces californicus]
MLLAFTVDPWYALWVLGFVVIYQQFENYVLQPKLTAKTVDIHPAVAFGSVIAGTALLGAVGALVAIPAVATLQAFLGAYVKRYDVTDDPRVHGGSSRRPGRPLSARLRRLVTGPPAADAGGRGAPAGRGVPPVGRYRGGRAPRGATARWPALAGARVVRLTRKSNIHSDGRSGRPRVFPGFSRRWGVFHRPGGRRGPLSVAGVSV